MPMQPEKEIFASFVYVFRFDTELQIYDYFSTKRKNLIFVNS